MTGGEVAQIGGTHMGIASVVAVHPNCWLWSSKIEQSVLPIGKPETQIPQGGNRKEAHRWQWGLQSYMNSKYYRLVITGWGGSARQAPAHCMASCPASVLLRWGQGWRVDLHVLTGWVFLLLWMAGLCELGWGVLPQSGSSLQGISHLLPY